MGALREHDLSPLIEEFGLEYYFETGTGKG